MSKLTDILYELGDYFVTRAKKGFQVYKNLVTHSVCIANIGHEGQKGLERAKDEIDRRLNVDVERA